MKLFIMVVIGCVWSTIGLAVPTASPHENQNLIGTWAGHGRGLTDKSLKLAHWQFLPAIQDYEAELTIKKAQDGFCLVTSRLTATSGSKVLAKSDGQPTGYKLWINMPCLYTGNMLYYANTDQDWIQCQLSQPKKMKCIFERSNSDHQSVTILHYHKVS